MKYLVFGIIPGVYYYTHVRTRPRKVTLLVQADPVYNTPHMRKVNWRSLNDEVRAVLCTHTRTRIPAHAHAHMPAHAHWQLVRAQNILGGVDPADFVH